MSIEPKQLFKVIDDLGLNYRPTTNSYLFRCPLCDKPDKLYIRKKDGAFICFSCAETNNFKGKAEYALSVLTGIPLSEMKSKLYGEITLSNFEETFVFNFLDFQQEPEPEEPLVLEPKVYPYGYYPISHKLSSRGLRYLESRGIPLEVAVKYDLHYDITSRRVVFPVKAGGTLYGWQGRFTGETTYFKDGQVRRIPKILTENGTPRDKLVMFYDRLTPGDKAVISEGPLDSMKCFGIDTMVMMSDGSSKAVQNIVVGDQLMGPDGNARNVLSVNDGFGPLYKITPSGGGDSWVCNGEHILSLEKRHDKKPIYNKIEISVNNYLKYKHNTQQHFSLYRAILEFPEKSLSIPPYILGIWLGDGDSDQALLTSMDSEIAQEWCNWVNKNDDFVEILDRTGNKASKYAAKPFTIALEFLSGKVLRKRNGCKGKARTIMTNSKLKLNELGVLNNKHIPDIYLHGSRQQRLELLAGLIDTDGTTNKNHIRFTQKSKVIVDSFVWLSRSLGFKTCLTPYVRSTSKTPGRPSLYYSVTIGGDLSEIPLRVPRKKVPTSYTPKHIPTKSQFKINSVEDGVFYGIETDGDHLFLLKDFTVVHNCDMIGGNVASMGKIVTKHQIQLLRHLGIKKIYLGLDPDALDETIKLVQKYEDEFDLYLMEPSKGHKDLGEMTFEEVLEQYSVAKRINKAKLIFDQAFNF